MILTKEDLKRLQESMRISISDNLKRELLNEYGHSIVDNEGHIFEYSEQDIYEQIRKIIQNRRVG